MKKLGIIGGAGPLASALLYETIIQESYLQALDVPEIFLINYPFSRGLTVEEKKKNTHILHNELQYCMNFLVQNGVEIGIVACNTLHLYMEQLPKSTLPFLSLPNLVIEEAIEKGDCHLLLLGTQNTCRSHLYRHPKVTIQHLRPREQNCLDGIIDHILEGRVIQDDSLKLSQIIQQSLENKNFDAVILGCSDLPVLHHRYPIQSLKPLYDSIKIPAQKIRGIL